MADPAFRDEQRRHLYDEHIAPINRFVDSLVAAGPGWLPHIAPMYGGVHARLLSILRDPGPKTRADAGSGFLSMENDDPTAERISNLFNDAGIGAKDIVPWNAYPWYVNRAPKAAELEAGVEPIRRLIELLPKLRVIMIHGRSAQRGWKRFMSRHGQLVLDRDLLVVSTWHTSQRALLHRNSAVREMRMEDLKLAFRQAAARLNDTDRAN
jgi:hypothetical protein